MVCGPLRTAGGGGCLCSPLRDVKGRGGDGVARRWGRSLQYVNSIHSRQNGSDGYSLVVVFARCDPSLCVLVACPLASLCFTVVTESTHGLLGHRRGKFLSALLCWPRLVPTCNSSAILWLGGAGFRCRLCVGTPPPPPLVHNPPGDIVPCLGRRECGGVAARIQPNPQSAARLGTGFRLQDSRPTGCQVGIGFRFKSSRHDSAGRSVATRSRVWSREQC